MIGRRRLLPDDLPPDLAIEIDLTSKAVLTAYRYLRVPEVWIYDQGRLTIYCLEGDDYCPVLHSQFFGAIPLTAVVPHYIEGCWQVGNFQTLQEWETYCYDRENAPKVQNDE